MPVMHQASAFQSAKQLLLSRFEIATPLVKPPQVRPQSRLTAPVAEAMIDFQRSLQIACRLGVIALVSTDNRQARKGIGFRQHQPRLLRQHKRSSQVGFGFGVRRARHRCTTRPNQVRDSAIWLTRCLPVVRQQSRMRPQAIGEESFDRLRHLTMQSTAFGAQ